MLSDCLLLNAVVPSLIALFISALTIADDSKDICPAALQDVEGTDEDEMSLPRFPPPLILVSPREWTGAASEYVRHLLPRTCICASCDWFCCVSLLPGAESG